MLFGCHIPSFGKLPLCCSLRFSEILRLSLPKTLPSLRYVVSGSAELGFRSACDPNKNSS